MIIIDDKIVSDDVVKSCFACDLMKCKGACCVEGDSGAPLAFDELDVMEDIVETVSPYLTPEGLSVIKNEGPFYLDNEDGVMKTSLIDGKACVFVNYKNGISYCGIEKAWLDKKVSFRKPVSCHLYPIRIERLHNYEALNYEQWDICKPACSQGKKLEIPIYKFAKQALIRKYGNDFYEKLDATVAHLSKEE